MDQYKSPMQRLGLYTPGSVDAQIGENLATVAGAYGMASQIPSLTSRIGNWWNSLWSEPTSDLPIPASPNASMQNNANARGTYVDPLTGQTVPANGTLAADHIVPQDWIKAQSGFQDLLPAQQDWLLNHPLNTQGLPTTFNSSKGAKLPGDWTTYKGQQLDPAYIQNDALRGQMLQNWIQEQIRTFGAANAQGR
jgi:filamentous hemagglutinin